MPHTALLLIVVATVTCTLGETSIGDSASECVAALKISSFVCQTAAASGRMCEANRRAASDICDGIKDLSSISELSNPQGFTSYDIQAKRAASRELQGRQATNLATVLRRFKKKTGQRLPHEGFPAADTGWFKPYRAMILPRRLRKCNPASCFNPKRCRIPACKSLNWDGAGHIYKKAARCQTGKCPGLRTNPIQEYDPNKNIGFNLMHPFTRLGLSRAAITPPSGLIVNPGNSGTSDNYLYLARPSKSKFYNPDKMAVMSKSTLTHSGLDGYRNPEAFHTVVFVSKTILCFKTGAREQRKTKCYSAKRGRCMRLDRKTLPMYGSDLTKSHLRAAHKELIAGRWSECKSDALFATDQAITGM